MENNITTFILCLIFFVGINIKHNLNKKTIKDKDSLILSYSHHNQPLEGINTTYNILISDSIKNLFREDILK